MEEPHAQALLLRWFAGFFARELEGTQIAGLSDGQADALIDGLRYFLGESAAIAALSTALSRLTSSAQIEKGLAGDYAILFLLPGPDSAPPFASCYASPGLLFGPSHHAMQRRLARARLTLEGDGRQPADHVSVMLEYLAHSLTNPAATEDPASFIQSALMPWVPDFARRIRRSQAGRQLYAPVAALLSEFLGAIVLASRSVVRTTHL